MLIALIAPQFDLYDTSEDGFIEECEMENMLKELYGKDFDTNGAAQRLMSHLTGAKDRSGMVTVDSFRCAIRLRCRSSVDILFRLSFSSL